MDLGRITSEDKTGKKKHGSAQVKVHQALVEVGIISWPEVEAALSVRNQMQFGDIWESKFPSSGKGRISNYTLILN